MHGLTEDELDMRFADVMTNTTILTEEGKLGIGGILWLEKFAHIQEELGFRGKGFPIPGNLGARLNIPKAKSSALGAAVRKQIGGSIPTSFTLFKYGKREHLRRVYEEGRLRLSPASHYRDPSLNAAVADDELSFEKIRGKVRTRYTQKADYYCFCSSWLHGERLISDFDATAVLVVTDPHEFFVRLASALNEVTFEILFNRVTYVDPLLLDDHEISDLRFVKHMRFAYQMEHRWVAMPANPMKRLDKVELVLGSLKDISVLHGS